MCVPFKRQLSNARVPLRAYPTSFSYPVMIYTQREREREREIKLSFFIPTGFYGKVVGSSSLANVHGIGAFNGTVDTDYRRTVSVVLLNLSDNEYIVEIGNIIAQ